LAVHPDRPFAGALPVVPRLKVFVPIESTYNSTFHCSSACNRKEHLLHPSPSPVPPPRCWRLVARYPVEHKCGQLFCRRTTGSRCGGSKV
jgi:hypothetical protein